MSENRKIFCNILGWVVEEKGGKKGETEKKGEEKKEQVGGTDTSKSKTGYDENNFPKPFWGV